MSTSDPNMHEYYNILHVIPCLTHAETPHRKHHTHWSGALNTVRFGRVSTPYCKEANAGTIVMIQCSRWHVQWKPVSTYLSMASAELSWRRSHVLCLDKNHPPSSWDRAGWLRESKVINLTSMHEDRQTHRQTDRLVCEPHFRQSLRKKARWTDFKLGTGPCF